MKIIKGLAIFSIVVVIFGSCFKNPEFSMIPEISFNEIYFKVASSPNDADTLVLVINFKDGDGDLGLDQANEAFLSTPFQEKFFYLEKNGTMKAISSVTTDRTVNNKIEVLSKVLDIPAGVSGKLVTKRTKYKPGYDTIKSLHPYAFPYTCLEYKYDSVIVKKADAGIFDVPASYVKRTIPSKSTNPEYYVVADTFYYQLNPNFYNIEVEFQVKDPSNKDPNHPGYSIFDWRLALCGENFNKRFPVLDEGLSNTPREGTLKYNMNSKGFLPLFDNGKAVMRLKIQIKDRTLHLSNIVYTHDFTLEDIRR